MRLLVCLFLALACGSATYLAGAVVWSMLDPQGAGAALLFTIPVAIAAAALPAVVGTLALVNQHYLAKRHSPRCAGESGQERARLRGARSRKQLTPLPNPLPGVPG
jgi:hypothetical protein